VNNMSENRRYRQIRTSRVDDIPATVARIFKYLSKYRLAMITVFVCIIIGSLTNVASSYFFAPIIDDHIVPYIGQQDSDLTQFISMLTFMSLIYLTGITASYIWRKLMSIISTGLLNDVRTQLFAKMQNMPVSFFDSHTHGELMNFYTNDIDTMKPLIADTLPAFISTSISVAGVLFMMFKLNTMLTAVSLVAMAIMAAVIYILGKNGRKYFMEVQKGNSDINGYVEEMFQGQKVVKVFQHEKAAIEQFEVYARKVFDAASKAHTSAGMLMPINVNISYCLYAVVAVLGAKMTIEGTFTLGALSSFLLYTRQISGPVNNLSSQFHGMMTAISGAERVFRIIDSPDEADDGKIMLVNALRDEEGNLTETKERTGIFAWKNPVCHSLTELKGDIRFDEVVFGYQERKTVLHQVSLHAKPGQKIAFVGSTGAGKTTITNLINRFYDINKGRITYDGIDIKLIKKDSLRSSLGMVLQETNLFSGTVMDNIRYGNLQADDEQCIEAAKLANADSFISRLPQGYNTTLTANGNNLSQGQRQLLNIARAAVANPPVLILDEATSSIDTHTERLIENGLDRLMAGRTVFVIAHRLSTVRNADTIVVLENGEIIERGNHDALLELQGRYYQLYTGKAQLE